MYDSHSTPDGTDAALRDSANKVHEAISSLGLTPQASVGEVVRGVPRLLTDTATAAMTGNRGDARVLLLALLDIRQHTQQISEAAEAAIHQVLSEHPELAEHYQWAEETHADAARSTPNRDHSS